MLTYSKAEELLLPGEEVFSLTESGGGDSGAGAGDLRWMAGNGCRHSGSGGPRPHLVVDRDGCLGECE